MIMKINGTDPHSQLIVYRNSQVNGNRSEAGRNEKANAGGPQQDRVALSGRGRMIADAQRAIASIPDVRESMVSRVQNDLQDGTYVFDNQRTAEGILRESMVNLAAMA
jgi:negative regulator of flagellin synthesis FlgM